MTVSPTNPAISPRNNALRRRTLAACLAAILGAVGCGERAAPTPTPPPPPTSKQASAPAIPEDAPTPSPPTTKEAVRSFSLRGLVARLDKEHGIAAIKHDEIPGYMPAMTMPFSLAGDPVLDELQVGDKVEGTLVVTPTSSSLENLIITELAEPPGADTTSASAAKRAVLAPGAPVPDFRLTLQDGTSRALSDYRGNIVVLTFIYTRCPLPDYCPRMDRKFAELERRVALLGDAGSSIRLLSVSFDPEHDTPEVLARHARAVGAKPPRWSFAVAAHDELRKVAEPLGLTYGDTGNEIIHTLSTAIIGPDGTLDRLERGNAWSVDDVFSAIRSLAKRTAPDA